MGQIKGYFLGDQYTFPKEISDYVFYSNRIQESSTIFFEKLTKRIQSKWYEYPDNEFENLFIDEAKHVIQMLSEDEIYDVTLSELLNSNTGYKFFKEFTDAGFQEWKNIAVSSTEEYIDGLKKAQFMADSQVTGSGVSLYSSSLLAHMTFAALESNTIKKQEREAEKVYKNVMSSLEKNTHKREEREQNKLLYNYLYPAYGKSITMFFEGLRDSYLEILQNNDIFDYSKLKKYDVEKSMELLDNLSVVKNKKQVLTHAFINCPYNTKVFEEVINCGLMDLETLNTAQVLGKDSEVVECIENYCNEHIEEKENVIRYADLIAFYKNTTRNAVLNEVYHEEKEKIKDFFRNLRILLDNLPILKRKIETKISAMNEKEITISEDEIKEKVNNYIEQIDSARIKLLLEYEVIDFNELNMTGDTLNSIDQIASKYKKNLTEKIKQYVEEIEENEKEKIKKEIAEMEELRKEYSDCWIISLVAAIISVAALRIFFIPIYEPDYFNFLATWLVINSVLLIVSILSATKKMTQKKIGVISGWIGCWVSGISIVMLLIGGLGMLLP